MHNPCTAIMAARGACARSLAMQQLMPHFSRGPAPQAHVHIPPMLRISYLHTAPQRCAIVARHFSERLLS